MDLIIEERGRNHEQTQQVRMADIRLRLKDLPDQARADNLLHLAEALLVYSHSRPLLKLSGDELLQWLQMFLDFLHCRDDLVNLRYFQPVNASSSYLLVNTPDVPYLVDSLKITLQRLQLRGVIISHPVLPVTRVKGLLKSLAPGAGPEMPESFMLVQFEGERDIDTTRLEVEVRKVLRVAQAVGQQRQALKARLAALNVLQGSRDQKNFADWLLQGNFVCFGHAVIEIDNPGGCSPKARLREDPLGWLPGELLAEQGRGRASLKLAGDLRERLLRRHPVVVEVLDTVSLLHYAENLVYIGFRDASRPDTWCEHLFVGLFSQKSVNELVCNVPPLRDKLQLALQRQRVRPDSYDSRKIQDIFDTFPKVEMFFLDDDELDSLVRSFISLQRQQSVKLVVSRGLSLSGITLLAIMPRDYYSREAVRRMETYLSRFIDAEQVVSRIIAVYTEYINLHFRIVPKGNQVRIDVDALEKVLTDIARPWEEKLRLLLMRRGDRQQGLQLWQRYATAFPHEYKDLIHPRYAVRDVHALEDLLRSGGESFDLWGPYQGRRDFFRLQFYSLHESCLNELMPFLENLNLAVVDEVDFRLDVDGRNVFIKSFSIRNHHPQALPLAPLRDKLIEILDGLRRNTVEDDYLNRLMVLTGLDWKEIDVFRAYRNYYFQLGNPFTKKRAAFALINNPQAAGLLYRYFEGRFKPNPVWDDPLTREEEALMPIRLELAEALNRVRDINEDRILRTLFNLIDSTVRTNFFLRRDDSDYFLSFKISAIGIIDMPFPRPLYETYVHSASMEGIHLRGGKVARGGIRWSDRPDDFRTEVLGLLKTQMTKNALIVPVGSKGGFVVKTPYTSRNEGGELSRQAYITLMRGLLDLVDNRVAGAVEHPRGVVVYDSFDPYLVVAADKGTAHLPDTANSVSLEYGFWLGDAFASGGSVGYDHKKLGITARGAWECVKRHFRELGKNIQTENFTVVGIGDMSGDVFGNGMLLSKHIRLLAAFNHMHIFLDPDPDPAISWFERQRLFDTPRTTWADYDVSLISKGGGVWERASKEIPLSLPVRKWLGVRHATMEGDELIRRLLTAEAELLWNGGIGTYVKAGHEKHAEVGDRANDNVRVNANQLQVKVIGEGGNLGFTQAGRIEFSLAGGCMNTDAIDNSAGVDTSDHEVNLKIFYQGLRELGVVKTLKTRNSQLQEIQNDVCDQVLNNNYMQSLCLSLDLLRCRADSEPFIDLTERLANAGLLDRQVEGLPSRKELVARGQGYQRPELAILLSYSKMHLYQTLLESALPDAEAARSFFQAYFPEPLRKRHRQHLDSHPLRREIIATVITNRVVNQAGCAFLNGLSRQSGASLIEGVSAYLVFDAVLDGAAVREALFATDNVVPAARQSRLLLALEDALAGLCRQTMELELPISLGDDCIATYRKHLQSFRKNLKEILPAAEWQESRDAVRTLTGEGLSETQAENLSGLRSLQGFLPTVHIAEETGAELLTVARIMGEVRLTLRISRVVEGIDEVVAHDRWDRMALSGLRSAFIRQTVHLTNTVVASGKSSAEFFVARRARLDYYLALHDSLALGAASGVSPYTVLLRALEGIRE